MYKYIMGKKCIVMFHQGWTDIILCIGLIFYNLDIYKQVILIIRDDSENLIRFIFRNNKNIVLNFIKKNLLDYTFYRNKIINYW